MAYWKFHYPKRNCFYPPDYENPGLGGSETALVLLTRQLVKRGHRVEVFNCCYRPGEYDGVRWRMSWELAYDDVPDAAVAVRFEESIWPESSKARRHLFWMLDDRARGPAIFADRFARKGGIVVLASAAMLQRIQSNKVEADIAYIPLPVEVDRYQPHLAASRSLSCLFASMPNRGLDVTLSFWPMIHEEVKDAELWVTGGWQLWGFMNSESDDRWMQVLRGKSIPEGVRIFGVLPRKQLCHIQQRAWCGLYPCRFPEMFCLTAAESGAAGTPMITSTMGALAERVEHNRTGILVSGNIEDAAVKQAFVNETITLLRSPERRDRLAIAAMAEAHAYTPDIVAAQWERLLT